jgi:uncharacterized membrane protein
LIPLLLVLCPPACTIAVPDIPPPPDHPTYDHDVHPYIADHCLVCHSSPSDHGAPTYFRLDVYADSVNLSGAGTMAPTMRDDAVYSNPHQMPPGGGLGPNGKQLIVNWAAEVPPQEN